MSKKRKLLATLPFEARCTAGGYGWICVGGEVEGHFAAIKVDNAGESGVDGRYGSEGRRAASVKVERIGEEIVNSISIHRVQDEEAHLDDIVAVLTNNDKTVRVYSLPQSQETRVLDLPFAMNHATISPDGQTMIAVGDFAQAFFFQREILGAPPQIHKPHNRLTSAHVKWTLSSVVNLHCSIPDGTEGSRGYFTTAWSPSGRLVAVGSEGGYISVFDVDMLSNPEIDDADAVVAVVPSSRPDVANPFPGAVRTMMFSPEPWDLLVWAEDQGRVCVGDLRTGLRTRQVINLEPKEESLDRVALDEVEHDDFSVRDLDELEQDFLSRYRHAEDNATAMSFANDYMEARRRQRQHQGTTSRQQRERGEGSEDWPQDSYPQGLTAQEQVILETLRTTRQREEARGSGRTVNYTTPDLFRDTGGGDGGGGRSASGRSGVNPPATRPRSDELHSVPDAGFPELSRTQAAASPRPTSSHGRDSSNTLPPLSSLNDSVWSSAARNSTGLTRLRDGSRLPRRRASVVLTPPSTNSSSTAPPSRPPNQATAEEDPTPEDDNPWRTIEEHMSLSRGPLFESAARAPPATFVPPPRPAADPDLRQDVARARVQARQRERWQSLRAELAGESTRATNELSDAAERYLESSRNRLPAFMAQGGELLLRRSGLRMGYGGREVGVRTAGLAMSGDGQTLWAACEEGIFEVGIKVKGRFFWPAVRAR